MPSDIVTAIEVQMTQLNLGRLLHHHRLGMELVSYFGNQALLSLVPSRSLEASLVPFENFLHWNGGEPAVLVDSRLPVLRSSSCSRVRSVVSKQQNDFMKSCVAFFLKQNCSSKGCAKHDEMA